jgi:hypothetical protein
MIKFRRKEFVHPLIARVLTSKPARAAVDGAIKVANSGVYKNIEKNTTALGKTIGGITTNPGASVRRATAGTLINPGMAAGVVADTAATAAFPALAASPIGIKEAFMALPTNAMKSPEKIQRIGRNMMRNNGATRASRIGKSIEYGVNKAALGASRIGSIMTGVI